MNPRRSKRQRTRQTLRNEGGVGRGRPEHHHGPPPSERAAPCDEVPVPCLPVAGPPGDMRTTPPIGFRMDRPVSPPSNGNVPVREDVRNEEDDLATPSATVGNLGRVSRGGSCRAARLVSRPGPFGRGWKCASVGRGSSSEMEVATRRNFVSTPGSVSGLPRNDTQCISSPQPLSKDSDGDGFDFPNNPTSCSVETMTAEIGSLKDRNEELSRTVNDLKIKLTSVEASLGIEQFTKKALTFAFQQKEAKVAELKSENEALKSIHEQVMEDGKAMGKKRVAKNIEEFAEEFPPKHLGLAFKVDKLIPRWATKEVAELDHGQQEPERLWTQRSEEVVPDVDEPGKELSEEDVYAVTTHSGKNIVPFNPIFLAVTGAYYTPSAPTARMCLQQLCQKEVTSDTWAEVLPTEQERLDALRAVSSNTTLITKLRQSLSDACSLRKRTARDAFFGSLGYDRLQSRYGSVIAGDLVRKELDISTAKEKILSKIGDSEVLDYSWWRTAPMEKLRNGTCPTEEGEVVDDENNGALFCFRDGIRKRIFYAFLGYDPSSGATPVECSILSLARLDAWICCVLQLISPKETRGGHRQRIYADTFYKNLEQSTAQVVGTLAHYVEVWNVSELRIPSTCDTTASKRKHVLDMERVATVLLRSPSTGKFSIAVKSSWFRTYVTTALGDIHDCVIASVPDDFHTITLLGDNVSTYACRTMPMPVPHCDEWHSPHLHQGTIEETTESGTLGSSHI